MLIDLHSYVDGIFI